MAEIRDIVVVNEEVDALTMRLDNIIKSIEASVDGLKGLNERFEDKVNDAYNEGYHEGQGIEDNMDVLQIENNRLKERIKELEQMYDEAVAKKSKPATPRWITEIGSVFKSVFKNDHRADDENFHKAFKFSDCLIACDGYRVICTAEPLADDIPRAENDEWAKKLNGFIHGNHAGLTYKSYELPPLSVLKEQEKQMKATKPSKLSKLLYVIKIDDGLVGFNFRFLADGMKATHSNQIRIANHISIATMQDGPQMFTTYALLPVNIRNHVDTYSGKPLDLKEGLNWI